MIKTKLKTNKGITLIALVITIIVLLILAGVTIAMLGGNNGTPAKANEASAKDAVAAAKDRINLVASDALLDFYNLTYVNDTSVGSTDVKEQAQTAVWNKVKVQSNYAGVTLTPNETKKTITVTSTKDTSVSATGTVEQGGGITWGDSNTSGGETAQAITVPAAGSTFAALSNEKNVKVKDDNDKIIIVPVGFRISPNSATTIEQGIVIEDENKNEFVWVPVGTEVTYSSAYNSSTLKTALKETATSGTITLARYDFGTKNAREHDIKSGTDVINVFFTENATKFTVGNTTYEKSAAKDITSFINQSNAAGGYYIGRYEMGQGKVCKSGQTVYNNVTRDQALSAAQGMYTDAQTKGKFTCDLVNSYAWDTAIVYMEKCGGNSNYAFQSGYHSGGPYSTGSESDEQCKINDMAKNVGEWTTEYSSNKDGNSDTIPCVSRGGYYKTSRYYTSLRRSSLTTNSGEGIGFRPLLYVSSAES